LTHELDDKSELIGRVYTN